MRACMLFIRGMGGRWGFEDAGGVLNFFFFHVGWVKYMVGSE